MNLQGVAEIMLGAGHRGQSCPTYVPMTHYDYLLLTQCQRRKLY
jgi:hypothetical protein